MTSEMVKVVCANCGKPMVGWTYENELWAWPCYCRDVDQCGDEE